MPIDNTLAGNLDGKKALFGIKIPKTPYLILNPNFSSDQAKNLLSSQ